MPKQIVPKHRGFTVLEITVAVAIIAILSALLVYGISHLTASAKANSTNLSLQNSRNMVQEFDSALNGLTRNSGHWPWCYYRNGMVDVIWVGATAAPTNAPAPQPTPSATLPLGSCLGLDFWNTAFRYDFNPPLGTLNSDDAPAPMLVPTGLFSADATPIVLTNPASTNRNISYAVLYTQLAMRMIGSISSGRAMMGNIPAGGSMVPVFVPGAPYSTGNTVKSPMDGNYYRATQDSTGSTTPTALTGSLTTDPSGDAGPGGHWVILQPGETPTPILLDAWGNPIIMVPGAGLVGVWTNGQPPATLPPTNGQIEAWATPPTSGPPLATYQQGPIVAADGKPFFVSAGPDGRFDAGDDNLYSFNK
jgi:prepilin-type N-terminal cleavage/methylation domain-containing protein